MSGAMDEQVPEPGQWPVDPQEDQPVIKERIWVDGCFDFAHHGHAGALLQARQLGTELYVGIHSDEAIAENKGPTVMTLDERVAAVDACRWVTKPVPHAPYVTYLPWISHYGCQYVVHGDDITSDAGGEDCYRYVKAAGRFLVVKRTPGISTTDLVGRMLLGTKSHFIRSLRAELQDKERGPDMMKRIKDYATDATGLQPSSEVWSWQPSTDAQEQTARGTGSFERLVSGYGPRPGQRVVYVNGGFDIFSSGHIEFLRLVNEAEHGEAYVVAGIHGDEVINHWKGLNYPIMSIFERGLCVLQCRYVHAVVFDAPFNPSKSFLASMPLGPVAAVYHGPTEITSSGHDSYVDARALGLLREIADHPFKHVNAREIMGRIIKGRDAFEERQRRKGQKAIGEEVVRQKELEALKDRQMSSP